MERQSSLNWQTRAKEETLVESLYSNIFGMLGGESKENTVSKEGIWLQESSTGFKAFPAQV